MDLGACGKLAEKLKSNGFSSGEEFESFTRWRGQKVCKLNTRNTRSVCILLTFSFSIIIFWWAWMEGRIKKGWTVNSFCLSLTEFAVKMIVNNRFVNCSNCHRQDNFSNWRVFATLKPAQHEFAISSLYVLSILRRVAFFLSHSFCRLDSADSSSRLLWSLSAMKKKKFYLKIYSFLGFYSLTTTDNCWLED